MGARSLSRWQRVFGAVTAEPVLARTPCDVLFVKNVAAASTPVAVDAPVQGAPSIDVVRASIDPAAVFESPRAVAAADDLSMGLRWRILQAWELDINAQLVEEGEGGPVRPVGIGVLDEINRAKEILELESS
jgi:hypothetical protein